MSSCIIAEYLLLCSTALYLIKTVVLRDYWHVRVVKKMYEL